MAKQSVAMLRNTKSGSTPGDKQRYAYSEMIGPGPTHKLNDKIYHPESEKGLAPRQLDMKQSVR